jgi:integrase
MGKQRVKPNYRRRVLRLPDLDHCKLAVLNSLGSPASRRVYEYAIDQFIAWYCSEPRLAFNRIVVVRYRMYLESRHLAANTINQQLAAVRRLAHEAADAGLLSPELAAGISRVKGVKQLGFRSGNCLSAEQSSEVLQHSCGDGMRAKRDYAMLAMLFGCGFRRSELVGLETGEIQKRQGHWAVVDLIGKDGHIRTVPIPEWVKAALDQWTAAARVVEGRIFRAVAKDGKGLGQEYLPECRVVRGQELLRESGPGAYCPARLAEDLCEAVPHERRRAGADPVSAGTRIGADDRTLPRLQTESRTSGKRSV